MAESEKRQSFVGKIMVITLLCATDMHATVEELLEAALQCCLYWVCIMRTKWESVVSSWQIAVKSQHSQSMVGCEHRCRRIFAIRSCCQVLTSENRTDLVCAIVIYSMCRLVRMLWLFVISSHKHSVNPVIKPTPVSGH